MNGNLKSKIKDKSTRAFGFKTEGGDVLTVDEGLIVGMVNLTVFTHHTVRGQDKTDS